jgi:hypothetical protein
MYTEYRAANPQFSQYVPVTVTIIAYHDKPVNLWCVKYQYHQGAVQKCIASGVLKQVMPIFPF